VFALAATVFVASLAGSLHCAGMCGGLVAFAAAGGRRGGVHFAYHVGRLVSYAALGAAAGALGAGVDLGGSVVGVKQGAAVVAGLLMVGFGLAVLLRWRGVRVPHPPVPAPVREGFGRLMKRTQAQPPVLRAATIGLLSAFLPCGWLYAFVVTAAGTGSPLLGALAMTAFWAGTVPVLAALGLGVQRLAGPLRRHLPVATAVVLMAVGLATVFGRLQLPDYADKVGAGGGLGLDEAPCCADPAPDHPAGEH
jgi:sulfite exporter TauE/SafE